MPLPERFFYSVSQLADRWRVEEDSILQHIVMGSLQPSVFVDEVEAAIYLDDAPFQMAKVSGEIQFIPSMTLMTEKSFWLSGGMFMGNHVWADMSEPEVETHCSVLFMEAQQVSLSDIRVRFMPFIKNYEENVISSTGAGTNSEDMDPRERTTLLRMIRLLCELEDIDITKPYKAYEVLAEMAASKGLALPGSKNAMAEKLKAARDID
jgi:hypothetical protein